ncbi:MAG: hypothetical protein AB7Q16_18915 [Vicinamibacterales bacterium]
MPEVGSAVRSLPVTLTEAELLDRHQALATALDELDAEEGALARIKADYKATFEALHEEQARLRRIVKDRAEPRDVVVRHVLDVAEDVVRVVREDTGEVVETRAPTPDERQTPMFPD